MKNIMKIAALFGVALALYGFEVQGVVRKNPIPKGFKYEILDKSELKQRVHIATVNLKELSSLRIASAAGDVCSREELSSMGARHNPFLGVNIGSFRIGGRFDGCPEGLVILESYPHSDAGLGTRPTFVLDALERTFAIKPMKCVWEVFIDDQKIELDRINQPAGDDEIVAYNTFFGRENKTSVGGIELIVDRGSLIQIRNYWGSGSIPAQGYVVRIGAAHPLAKFNWQSKLTRKCSSTIKTLSIDLDRDGIFAVQGRLMLVQNGKILEDWARLLRNKYQQPILADEMRLDVNDNDAADNFINKKNAHTAIGMTPDGLLKIVVVEGGSSSAYEGMDIDTLACSMKALGCWDAMLVGSGADVGLWLNGCMLTQPGGNDQVTKTPLERPISTALLLFND